MRYNWQHHNWPNFEYDLTDLDTQDLLYKYAMESSALLGGFGQIPDAIQSDAIIDLMVAEALNTSEIEGEHFNEEDVRSSIKKELGIALPAHMHEPKILGISQLMVSVRQTFNEPLTEQTLFNWHEMVLADPKMRPYIDIGMWRSGDDPMQIISGAYGHEKVHFEAPPSASLAQEMGRFISWFNATAPKPDTEKLPGPVRAAIAHLYFESIHPFGDGNGRIGRALSEKALSQDLGRPVLLSLSTAIYNNKKEYYAELSAASRYNLDITKWINYFVRTVYQAQISAKQQIIFVLQKTKFWNTYKTRVNSRQEQVLSRIFKAGFGGFTGGISAQKYMKIADCSKATATRDLADLLQMGCIVKLPGSGRNTRYELALPIL